MLGYLAARAIAGVEHVSEGAYRRTFEAGGRPAWLELRRGGSDHLVLRARLPDPAALDHVVARARRLFGLDADVEAARRHLDADPVVGPLLRGRPGLRPPGAWDLHEIGVRAIVGQQVSVAGASTLAARIVERHGTPLADPPAAGLTHLFPAPATLAEGDLGGLGLTSSRVAAVGAFARAVAAGAVRLDRLAESITAVRGLGPWTAQYLALRLGDPDAFPETDLGLRRALGRGEGRPLGPREAAAAAAAWRPWRAHAAIHLWLGDQRQARPSATR